jgi:hypothetical protein
MDDTPRSFMDDNTPHPQRDEWLVGQRYLSAASMGPLLEKRPHRETKEVTAELQAA